MVREKAGRIVAVHVGDTRSVVRTHYAVTTTAFWSHLWRDFPNLSREMRTMLRRRKASDRIAAAANCIWVVGTGGEYVEQDVEAGSLDGYPSVLDPHLARGRVLLTVIEWESDR